MNTDKEKGIAWSRGGAKRVGAGSSSHENLYAMVMVVNHDEAPVAVDSDASIGVAELSVT